MGVLVQADFDPSSASAGCSRRQSQERHRCRDSDEIQESQFNMGCHLKHRMLHECSQLCASVGSRQFRVKLVNFSDVRMLWCPDSPKRSHMSNVQDAESQQKPEAIEEARRLRAMKPACNKTQQMPLLFYFDAYWSNFTL